MIPLSCAKTLRELGKASPEILAEVLTHIACGGERVVGRLQSEIGWVIGRVLRKSGAKAFSASSTHLNTHESGITPSPISFCAPAGSSSSLTGR